MMAQRNPEENIGIDQVLKLVNKLSPEKRRKLLEQLTMDDFANESHQCVDAADRCKVLPDEEVLAGLKNQGDDLETKFRELSARWRRETGALSITTKKITHPAYYQIIALGPGVVPLILEDLAARPAHWFTALEALTGTDPVAPEHRGRFGLMQQDWLQFGRSNNLI